MATLFSILQKARELIKGCHRGTATGGSTTTLIDSSLAGTEPDDWFNNGLIFMLTGDNANTIISPVTDYAKATGTFTFAAITTAIAAGDEYMACRSLVDKGALIRAVNAALQELGPVITYSNVSLSSDEQESYVLTGITNVRRVEIPNNTAEPYGWKVSNHWRETNNRIVFAYGQEPPGTLIRCYYMGAHGYVDEAADYVTDYLHPMLIAWTAVKHAMYSRALKSDVDERWSSSLLQLATNEADRMKAMHKPKAMPKDPTYSNW